jgi:hypothetical protein
LRTIIAGSRTTTQSDFNSAISSCKWARHISCVLSGTARGADKLGERWARSRCPPIPVERYHANWNRYGSRAGFIRNETMVEQAEALIAVWDGKSNGTRHMIEIAYDFGLKVYVYKFEPVVLFVPLPHQHYML